MDLAVLTALAIYGVIVVGGFFWRYRVPSGRVTGRGVWMSSLPSWARLVVTLVSLALTAWLTTVLWIRIPVALPTGISQILPLLGLVLYLVGASLTVWGRFTLGSIWTITSSAGVQLHADHRLITGGPFTLVRHPMYLGFLLVPAGLLLMYRTWILAGYLVMAAAAFTRRAWKEEEALEAAFGSAWRDYARRVGRWIPVRRKP